MEYEVTYEYSTGFYREPAKPGRFSCTLKANRFVLYANLHLQQQLVT
jgi:hypothetical protein